MDTTVIVSVVICTRNRAESLRRTLRALSRVSVPKDMPAELLVVDNGSTDITKTVVEEAQLQSMKISYLSEARAGLSLARNLGVNHARGQVLLFTDDDVEPPEDWIEKMCRPIITNIAHAVAGEIEPDPNLERPWLTGFLRTLVACTKHEPRIDLVGANMAFRRSIFQQIPQFDPELDAGAIGFGGDTLFSYQIERAGLTIHRASNVVVIHRFDPSRLKPKTFLGIAAKSGRSIAYIDYHWRHKSPSRTFFNYANITFRLFARRLISPGRWKRGVPAWEVSYVRWASYYRYHLYLQGSRRNYDRYGFQKLNMATLPRAIDDISRPMVSTGEPSR